MITRDELEVIWDALCDMRENCIPEGDPQYDAKWSDICTTMHKIEEELEIWESVCIQSFIQSKAKITVSDLTIKHLPNYSPTNITE